MNSEDKLRKWVLGELETVPYPVRFELKLVSVDGMVERLRQVRTNGANNHPDEAHRIASDIYDFALTTAKAMENMVRFRVCCLVKSARGEDDEGTPADGEGPPERKKVRMRGQFPFALAGKARAMGGPMNGIAESEAPTPTGLLAQLMRHNESLVQSNGALVEDVVEWMRETQRELTREVTTYRAKEIELREKYELVMSEAQKRAIEMQQFENKERRKDMMLGEGLKHLGPIAGHIARETVPRIVEKFTGGIPGSEKSNGGDEKIQQLKTLFLMELDDDTRATLIAGLPEAQREKLMSILGLG